MEYQQQSEQHFDSNIMPDYMNEPPALKKNRSGLLMALAVLVVLALVASLATFGVSHFQENISTVAQPSNNATPEEKSPELEYLAEPETENGHTYFLEPNSGRSKTAADDFAGYFAQKPAWGECQREEYKESGLQCAEIKAPLNWTEASEAIAPDYNKDTNSVENPFQQSVTLLLSRRASTNVKRGSMLMNPGGPGASGNSYLAAAISGIPNVVRSAYDIVGFDPRGVRDSTPVKCFTNDDEAYQKLYGDTILPDQDLERFMQNSKEWADGCVKNSGALVRFVDSESVAYDMNLIRAVVGDTRLTYTGFSYGTQLGQTFAGLFPERVGVLVLDGSIAPDLTAEETVIGQAKGFEDVVDAFMAHCISSDQLCPFTSSVEGKKRLRETIDKLGSAPKELQDGRKLNDTMFAYSILSAMYSQSMWKYLTAGLADYYKSGGTKTLELLADMYFVYDSKTKRFEDNQNEAFFATSCADTDEKDWKFNYEDWKKISEKLHASAPTLEKFFAGGQTCEYMPQPGFRIKFDKKATGSADILVVGNTNDPATPYQWSQKLAETLQHGHLMTVQADQHTAYTNGLSGVDEAIDGFIMNGIIPDKDKVFNKHKAKTDGEEV